MSGNVAAGPIDVLCAGILVADLFVPPLPRLPGPGELQKVGPLLLDTGGCAANTATDLVKLGVRAAEIHSQIGRKIVKSNVDVLISVGELAKHIVHGAHRAGMPRKTARTCRTAEEAAALLGTLISPGDIVLVKGSRAMKMENALKCFTGFSIR